MKMKRLSPPHKQSLFRQIEATTATEEIANSLIATGDARASRLSEISATSPRATSRPLRHGTQGAGRAGPARARSLVRRRCSAAAAWCSFAA